MSVTFEEILGQPQLWLDTYQTVVEQAGAMKAFFSKIEHNSQVVFAGAGSSAFVGEIVAGIFQQGTGRPTRAVATTDIVTHPELYFLPEQPLLLVSLARSGNSPESLAAIEIVDQLVPMARHLIITCNKDGALARLGSSEKRKVLVLPEKANDRGLAMIGSVTGMILAALLISKIQEIDQQASLVERAAAAATDVLSHLGRIHRLATLDFRRVVCLGSGPLLAVAREAHLKIQELSDGRVIAKFDSFLGFRHGPKAVVDAQTLMIYFASSDPLVARYEQDLVDSVAMEQKPLRTLAISEFPRDWAVDDLLAMSPAAAKENEYLILPALLPAQLLAVYKSQNLGLNPDSPSKVIHRVVQGVKIYGREMLA